MIDDKFLSPADQFASLPKATRGFLLNAALIGRFRPERLTAIDDSTFQTIPTTEDERKAGLSFVIDNSVPSSFNDPLRFGWGLNEDLRARVLDALGGLDRVRSAVASVEPGVGEVEPLKLYFERPAAAPDLPTLSARRQALVWLNSYLAGDDELRTLDEEIEREGLLSPLRTLAGANFVGRVDELDFLRRFVGVLPAPESRATGLRSKIEALGVMIGGLSSNLYDWVTTVFDDDDVVLVTAPGGMGKSALLARFMLQHWETKKKWQVPFAFLDFDRPSLLSRDASVPLEEIARQLSIQLGMKIEPPRRTTSPSSSGRPAQESDTPSEEMAIEASDADRAYFRQQELDRFVHRIAEALARSDFKGKPLILVMDTLERVFRRGRHWIAAIDDLIASLRAAEIEVRVVAGGRAFLSELRANQTLSSRTIRWSEKKLRELDQEAAEQLLKSLEVPSKMVANIAQQVGGVPLSLHLAAGYIRRHRGDVAALSEMTRSWLLKRRLDDAVIQGNLYQRVLTHIEEPDVAKLACPGLVLREVTPALIRKVLAAPCGLGEVDEARSIVLFDKLAQEFTLVENVGPKRLRHRADVRQLMLKQMLATDGTRARAISEGAVQYYSAATDPKSRAEELYHRLLLGQDRGEIDARWLEGVEDYMGDEVLEDIPSKALRVYAATRLRITLSNEDWLKEADEETWERKVAQDFDARVKVGQVREALRYVESREEFLPGSPLYPLVAQAHADLHDFARAQKWIETGLSGIEGMNDRASRQILIDLMLVRARIFDHYLTTMQSTEKVVAREIEQLYAIWQEYDGDARVILIGLLEAESIHRANAVPATELHTWLIERMREVVERGDVIDPSLATRMLAVIGDNAGMIDAARWLIKPQAVREVLVRLVSQMLSHKNVDVDLAAFALIDKIRSRRDSADTGNSPAVLTADDIRMLALAVTTASTETRVELRGVAR
jgi:cellulose synthase operon protein C